MLRINCFRIDKPCPGSAGKELISCVKDQLLKVWSAVPSINVNELISCVKDPLFKCLVLISCVHDLSAVSRIDQLCSRLISCVQDQLIKI